MSTLKALSSGLGGALAVSALHETIRRFSPAAPRMDLLGMQAISLLLRKSGMKPPTGNNLYLSAMGGDLLSNSIYYSLAGTKHPKNVWVKGAILGAAAGIGAIMLPKPLGLKEEYSARSSKTKAMAFGLYLIGGLLTAALLQRKGK